MLTVKDAYIVQSSFSRDDFYGVAGVFVGSDNHSNAYDLDCGDVNSGSGDNMNEDDDPNDADYVPHDHDNADDCSNTQLLLAARNLLSMKFDEYSNNNNDYLLADEDLNKEERKIKYANGKKKEKVIIIILIA
jgi:hypothetical protein